MLNIEAGHLKNLIERIEKLEEEKAEIAEGIKEVYGEAKGSGYETKIMKQIIKERKMNRADLAEQEELLVIYKRALGMAPNFEEEAA
jgi:uncharacterized protein (UPF0335 family)